jgi:hypothetical protein
MGARPWVAHTQDDYAQMLVRRDGVGDLARASDLIGEASATYRALGMRPWASAAAVLGARLRA